MALRNIVKDGEPVLKKKARPVTKFDDRLAQLLDDMAETMMDADGLGLAAPQVGVLRRVFVAVEESTLYPLVDEDGNATEQEPKILEFVNPEVRDKEGALLGYEGCLSFPGRYAAIERPLTAVVHAQDRHGKPFAYEAEGLMARCVCHETNHLDGITIDDLAYYFYDPDEPHELDETLHRAPDEVEEEA
ncbi:MAG: peptide deformylase [Oscillospiraceae bacterium]